MAGGRPGKRIDPGEEVAEVAVRIDQTKNAGLRAGVGGRYGRATGPQVEALEE
jgi:hypothetical protein